MSKINELRTKRAKAWDKAQAFLTANRDDKGMTPAQAAAIPAVKEIPAQAGKTYDELMTRLNLIKP